MDWVIVPAPPPPPTAPPGLVVNTTRPAFALVDPRPGTVKWATEVGWRSQLPNVRVASDPVEVVPPPATDTSAGPVVCRTAKDCEEGDEAFPSNRNPPPFRVRVAAVFRRLFRFAAVLSSAMTVLG